MDFYINTRSDLISIEDLKDLWISVGWDNGSILTPERLLSALKNSSKLYLAWVDSKLIGLVSALDDGLNVCITYMVVHKDFQNMGIGNRLLEELLSTYNSYKFQVCTSKANNFYSKFGFIEDMHGMTRIDCY